LLVAFVAGPVAAERLAMTIRVLDQAHLPVKMILEMERYVEARLAFIEIDVNWVDCATDVHACEALRHPNEFWLRILGQVPRDAGPDQVGYTQPGVPGGGGIQCVNVFHPVVEQVAKHLSISTHQMLGAAVAHEIGHLYLGTNAQAHSLAGIMCGDWSRREVVSAAGGELNFTREQGSRIRNAVRRAQGM
jgi:hypothetical protein